MSKYASHRDRFLDNDPHWERLMLKPLEAPRQTEKPQATEPQPDTKYAALRKAQPVNKLLPSSLTWLRSVPTEVRPVALANRYARIVNLLAHQWNDDDTCSAYLRSLLVDQRGNRQGFPAAVQSDIRVLQDYFLNGRPKANGSATVDR